MLTRGCDDTESTGVRGKESSEVLLEEAACRGPTSICCAEDIASRLDVYCDDEFVEAQKVREGARV